MNRPPAPPVDRAPIRPAPRPPAMPRAVRPPSHPSEPVEEALAPSAGPRHDRAAVRRARRSRRRALGAERRRPAAVPARRRLAVLAGLLLAAALVGIPLLLAFAPVFTLQAVTVSGGDASTAAAVRTALARERGRPLALVSDADVAAALRSVPRVASFSAVRRPPSTLELRVVPRTAVGAVQVAGGWRLLDASGVALGDSAAAPDGVPWLVLPGGATRAAALRTTAAALGALAGTGLQVTEVRAAGPDDVALSLASGTTVQWGGPEQSAAKARALVAALQRAAKRAATVDVSSPGVVLVR